MLRKLLTAVRASLPKALTRTLSTTTTNVSSSSFSPSWPSYFPSQPAFGGGRLWGGAMLRKLLTGVRVSLPKALTRTLSTTTTSVSSSSFPSSSPSQLVFAMKTVTRKNFESALETLRATLRDADFVARDVEMTGVVSAPWRESLEFDRPHVRYFKVKDSAEKFAVVQFGVCPFRWEDSSQTLIAYPHNFYIFPLEDLSVDLPSHEFLCQTTWIGFLAKHQFHFNTCIHEEISDVSRAQETEVVQYFRSNDDYQSADYYKDDKNMQGVEIILAMAPSAMVLLLVGFLFAAAGIGDRSDQDVKKLSDDVPRNSHELNFGGRSDQEVKELFEKWIVEHGKSYNDLTEKEKRFSIFKDNLIYIDRHNAGSHSYRLGINQFSDLNIEEFRSTYCRARCRPDLNI